ncbi:expressed unknown protein [Seminavis robusta]|uniref:Uncharacterized protein n=1 Tax=Seminavis robusta TaxID=568900 RepID=A0A9N8H694_9STRA|nr:expressed unknown protein [Seminavis robusta]|eukprot:Sro39_g024220.1 n/a (166) ;mRNA; r:106938-107435
MKNVERTEGLLQSAYRHTLIQEDLIDSMGGEAYDLALGQSKSSMRQNHHRTHRVQALQDEALAAMHTTRWINQIQATTGVHQTAAVAGKITLSLVTGNHNIPHLKTELLARGLSEEELSGKKIKALKTMLKEHESQRLGGQGDNSVANIKAFEPQSDAPFVLKGN